MNIDNELKELFKATASSAENRKAFAAAMAIPLLQQVAVESTVRPLFNFDELGPGEPAVYPLEAGDVKVTMMPRNGGVPVSFIPGNELWVQTFPIAGGVEWALRYARDGKFNVAQRQLQRLKNELVVQENTNGWAVIKAKIDSSNTVNSTASATALSKSELNKIFKHMQGIRGYNLDVIVLNANRWGDIRDWATTEISISKEEAIHSDQGITSLWGTRFIVNPDLADDEIYGFDVSKFGIMSQREGIQVQEDPSAIQNLNVRFYAWEEVGFAAVDSKAVVKFAFV